MTHTIPAQDVAIIHRGEARFPVEGSQCNASCAFYAFCGNSQDFGTCKGFILMNGENLAQIKRDLDEKSVEYITNAYPVIQRSLTNGDRDFADAVTRDVQRLGAIVSPIQFESQIPDVCSAACPRSRHCSSFPISEGSVCPRKTSTNQEIKERNQKNVA